MANDQKKQTQQKSLASLCTKDKLTRCDYFSDTYTAVMTVNNEKKLMDITHISLPFKQNREKAVMDYFDIDREGMQELYTTLAACVTNNARTTTFLNREKNTKSIVSILRIESVKKKVGRGSDIYMVTEHLRPLVQTYFNGETTVKNIVNFGARLAKMVADIHQSEDDSVTLRVPDPEQIFVADDGKFVFGCFHYAYNIKSTKEPIQLAVTAPLHISPKVSRGEAGDEGTDMFSISSMLWSLLNGDGFDKTTPTGTPPKYAPEAILPILEMGFQADPEMFLEFKKKLMKLNKELSKPENNGDMVVPVPIAERPIENPTAILDLGVEEEVYVPQDMDEEEKHPATETETVSADEQPVYEEPAYEEPTSEEPVQEEPAYEEPTPEESVQEEPTPEEPISEERDDLEPEYEEPTNEEPVSEEPVYKEPIYKELTYEEPVREESLHDEAEYKYTEPEENPFAREPDVEPSNEQTTETEEPQEEVAADVAPPVSLEKKPLFKKPNFKLPTLQKSARKPKPEVVEISEDDVVQEKVKVLNTTEYLEEHEAETTFVPSTMEELMNITVTYHKPKFFLDQLFMAFALGSIVAVMIYVSITQHLFTFW